MMRRLFRFIDETLRRRQNIEEFYDDPECLFRIRRCRAERRLPSAEGEIPAGAELLELHYWNEHMPRLAADGPDLAWASKGRRMLFASLVELAHYIDQSPECRTVAGVIGITTFLSPEEAETGQRLLQRLGFDFEPYRNPMGAFGDFWENLYVWFLNRTFGGKHVRRRSLAGLRRFLVWMPRKVLVGRYAPKDGPPGVVCSASRGARSDGLAIDAGRDLD